jgi:hypothetical protein
VGSITSPLGFLSPSFLPTRPALPQMCEKYRTLSFIHNDPDKIWKTADSNIKKAFKSYPPAAKAIEEKKAEWAKMGATKKSAQP